MKEWPVFTGRLEERNTSCLLSTCLLFFLLVITSLSYPIIFPILPPPPQRQRFKPTEVKYPLKTKSLNWLKLHFSVCSLRFVKEWGWCYGLFGKCPLRTGTVNDCFPLSPTDSAKYPAGTEKILIDVDFLTYYLNMLNGPWEAFEKLTCYPKYMTYPGSTLLFTHWEFSISVFEAYSFCKFDEFTQEEVG